MIFATQFRNLAADGTQRVTGGSPVRRTGEDDADLEDRTWESGLMMGLAP